MDQWIFTIFAFTFLYLNALTYHSFLISLKHNTVKTKSILNSSISYWIMEVSVQSESQELHVLAVDDSLVERKVIEKLLKVSSCRVTAVESGTRALQFLGLDGDKGSLGFNGLKVNLIMTDYSMPGMTGYELLKKIKRSSALREIPVVIMSSESILTRIDSCLEEGAEEFLVKPVKLSDVKRLMKDCITRGEFDENKSGRVLKRKFEDDNHTSSSSSSLSPSTSTSPLPSSPSSVSSFGCDTTTSEVQSSPLHSLKRAKLCSTN